MDRARTLGPGVGWGMGVWLTLAVVVKREDHTLATDAPHGVAVLDVAQQQLSLIEGPGGGVVYLTGTQEPGAVDPGVTTVSRGNGHISLNNAHHRAYFLSVQILSMRAMKGCSWSERRYTKSPEGVT